MIRDEFYLDSAILANLRKFVELRPEIQRLVGAIAQYKIILDANIAIADRDRVRSSVARAKRFGTKSGRPIGRPPIAREIEAKVEEMVSAGTGKLKIARCLGIGTGTVSKIAAKQARPTRVRSIDELYLEFRFAPKAVICPADESADRSRIDAKFFVASLRRTK